MLKEIVLQDLQELTGTYRGITTNRLFTLVVVGDNAITLETERPPTKAIVKQLQKIEKGTKIAVLKIGGTLRVRRSEGNK